MQIKCTLGEVALQNVPQGSRLLSQLLDTTSKRLDQQRINQTIQS
jgi:hypothetical protein